jgi:hypothetical protein
VLQRTPGKFLVSSELRGPAPLNTALAASCRLGIVMPSPARFIALALSAYCSAPLAQHGGGVQTIPCNTVTVTHERGFTIEQSLGEAICTYYTAQEAQDWAATYQLRPSAFRQVVPPHVYASEMSKRPPALKLTLVHIRSAERTGIASWAIRADFIRTRDGTLSSAKDRRLRYALLNERTEWMNESGAWKCPACGESSVFALNTRVVYED